MTSGLGIFSISRMRRLFLVFSCWYACFLYPTTRDYETCPDPHSAPMAVRGPGRRRVVEGLLQEAVHLGGSSAQMLCDLVVRSGCSLRTVARCPCQFGALANQKIRRDAAFSVEQPVRRRVVGARSYHTSLQFSSSALIRNRRPCASWRACSA